MSSASDGKSGMGLDSKVGRTKLLPCTAYTRSEFAPNSIRRHLKRLFVSNQKHTLFK